MVNYEGMFLLDSGKFAADHEGTVAHLMEILEKAGAEVVAHRPWQDGKLAYEIEGHMKGLHYLVYFTMPGSGMDLITRACHLSDMVIRQMVIKQPQTLFDAMVSAIDPTSAPEPVAVESKGDSDSDEAGYDAIDDDDEG
ncbi:30S ribosomal protein S6 [Gimesia algae]|nr:30S ribosomal protein S6 [Gimesia algae]